MRLTRILLAAVLLAGCGDDEPGDWRALADRCAEPRTGLNPFTGEPWSDVQGTLGDEKRWLRGWTDHLYLWYREVPDLDPDRFPTPLAYFDVLKTPAVTASGKPRDRFHFTFPTDEWIALSGSGIEVGYGVQWIILSSTPPRRIVAAYLEPDSPASAAGLMRGSEVVSVDGIDVAAGSNVAGLNQGFFPSEPDQTHTFVVRDRGAAETRTVTMTSAPITLSPVQTVKVLPTPSGPVGYLAFHDHLATAEAALIDAIEELAAAQVVDLVFDLRYNGGGYLAIAGQLAYMIAGPERTAGKAFDRIRFNDKHPTHNPVTGEPLAPTPFHTTTLGFSTDPDLPLPHLGLGRVFVLAGGITCSASESIINGLRGIDVEVVLIGATTCGKPYGFYPYDNCGTTYFSIQFEGQNDKGFGDYADGFSPAGAGGGASVPGCAVADDYLHDLGDPGEARLRAALGWRDASGSCPPGAKPPAPDGAMVKPPWRENRLYR